MFTQKSYKKVLPEALCDMLNRNTDSRDCSRAAELGDISPSLVTKLIYRRTTLTENNYKAIVELAKIAKLNCETTIRKAQEDLKSLELLLNVQN